MFESLASVLFLLSCLGVIVARFIPPSPLSFLPYLVLFVLLFTVLLPYCRPSAARRSRRT